MPPKRRDHVFTQLHTLVGFLKRGVTPTEAPFSGGVQEAAFSRGGGGLYGYVCRLPIHQYGFHNSGAGAEGASSTVVEVAEGRLHIGGWEGGKHSHTTHPHPY